MTARVVPSAATRSPTRSSHSARPPPPPKAPLPQSKHSTDQQNSPYSQPDTRLDECQATRLAVALPIKSDLPIKSPACPFLAPGVHGGSALNQGFFAILGFPCERGSSFELRRGSVRAGPLLLTHPKDRIQDRDEYGDGRNDAKTGACRPIKCGA